MEYATLSEGLWYIFWETILPKPTKKTEEFLACWYAPDTFAKNGSGTISFSYTEVKEFLVNPDWSIWARLGPGRNRITLVNCMQRWLTDVDKGYNH